jgi:hypothetical protein
MATVIKQRVIRETHGTVFSQGEDRAVIVSIEPPNVLGFRLKGTRQTYYLTADGLFLQALRVYVDAEKRERAKAREARKGG